MSGELAKIEETISAPSAEVLKKKLAWANVGESVYNGNIALQVKAEELKLKLKVPTNLKEAIEAEATIKSVKGELKELIEDRKAITSRFDKVSEGLMAHEKSVAESIVPVNNKIIELRREEEARVAKEKSAITARAELKEKCLNAINIGYNQYYTEMAEKIQLAYEHALKKEFNEEQLKKYLTNLRAAFTVENFTMKVKEGSKPESVEVWNEAFAQANKPTPEEMLAEYHKKVEVKFEYYTTAIKNAKGALEASKIAKEKEEKERNDNLNNQIAATKLEVMAETSAAVVQTDGKELKKKWVIDMEDGEISTMLILSAFMMNFNKAKHGVKVTNWMNLNVGQMGAALAYLKNQDDRFVCTGIQFKIEEKV